MTLEEAVKRIETCYKARDGKPTRPSQTGEDYITVVSGGIKEEGERLPALYSTPELAVDAWYRTVMYLNYPPHLYVYWRCRPSLDEVEIQYPPIIKGYDNKVTMYTVYSRLLITDKEPIG